MDEKSLPHRKLRAFRKLSGAILITLGWILSPLSWWNDAFVNLPLSWLMASLIVKANHAYFSQCLILCYWLTNLAGFVLIYFGWRVFHRGKKISRKELLSSFFVSLVYTLGILILIKLNILKPIF